MANTDVSEKERDRLSAGQWFVLALLVLLNGAVLVLLVLTLTGRLTL